MMKKIDFEQDEKIDRWLANLFGTYRLEAAFGTPLKSEIGSEMTMMMTTPARYWRLLSSCCCLPHGGREQGAGGRVHLVVVFYFHLLPFSCHKKVTCLTCPSARRPVCAPVRPSVRLPVCVFDTFGARTH